MKTCTHLAILLILVISTSCAKKQVIEKSMTETVTEYESVLDAVNLDENLSDLESFHMETLREIESNLNSISQIRSLVYFDASEGIYTLSRKERIVREIQFLNSLLAENGEEINRMKSISTKNAAQNETLERILRQMERKLEKEQDEMLGLKEELINRDFEISDLTKRIEDLEYEKSVLEAEYQKLSEESKTAYITFGTYKDLKKKGIIKSVGGIFKLNGDAGINTDFPAEYFEALNIYEETAIPIEAKSVNIITEHPTGSYELMKLNDHTTLLHITKPKEFWKTSRYLVVQI